MHQFGVRFHEVGVPGTAEPPQRGHRDHQRTVVGREAAQLWHEAYIVPEGSYESIYADMPPFGLAAATGVLPLESRGRRAADRLAHRSGASANTPYLPQS